MKTNVSPTSLSTYRDLQSCMGEWEWNVYCAIRANPRKTRRELAELLDTDSSSVSGRVNSLTEAGLVLEDREGTYCSITGKRAGRLYVNNRWRESYLSWSKQLRNQKSFRLCA